MLYSKHITFTVLLITSKCALLFGQITNPSNATLEDSMRISVSKAIGYFESFTALNYQVYLLNDYLIREYDFKLKHNEFKVDSIFNKHKETKASLDFFYRIIHPSHKPNLDRLNEVDDHIEFMMIRAMYCHRINASFLSELSKEIEMGGYPLTHAVITLQWLKENACIQVNQDSLNILIDGAAQRLMAIFMNPENSQDLRIEALAVLVYTGNGNIISDIAIRAVINSQLSDGGWSKVIDGKSSNQHTTVLAAWLLLGKLEPEGNPKKKWTVK